ncbi:MAG: GtrA family protein [Phocaeicola sp.]|nr:GtrA family protein [Phocaeicola sp.]
MHTSSVINEFVRFGIVGVAATATHYGIYYLLQPYINVNIAYTTGYALSFIANFYLTSYFTFGAKPSWKKLMGMGGAHLVNYLLHIVLLNLFLFIGITKTWAPVPVFVIAIPVNFLLIRFVFKHKKL